MWTERASHKAGFVSRTVVHRGFVCQTRRGHVDRPHLGLQIVLSQDDARTTERIGQDNVRPSLEVGGVNSLHHIGSRHVQVFITAFIVQATEIIGSELFVL